MKYDVNKEQRVTELPDADVILELPTLLARDQVLQIGATAVGVRRARSILDERRIRPLTDGGYQYTLPLLLTNSRHGLELSPGLTVISGATAAGKSDFIRHLSTVMNVQRYLSGEPYDSEEDRFAIPYFQNVDAAITAATFNFLATPDRPPLPVIDSFRRALFEMEGAAGTKGIIPRFFTTITDLNNALYHNGVTILAIINPMMRDKEYVAEFLSMLSAATQGYIEVQSRRAYGQDVAFEGTVALRGDRIVNKWTFSAKANVPFSTVEEVDFAVPAQPSPSTRFSLPQHVNIQDFQEKL